MKKSSPAASLILAAGRGSRMKGYEGSKTLLPLVAGKTPFQGTHPLLIQILKNLPPGPKALVVHHRKEEVMNATRSLDLTYCEQPVLNGTGGALLAARPFIEDLASDRIIITMGDVPFVKRSTYDTLVANLDTAHFVVLGFKPSEKKEYGVLELERERVSRIIEWKYWRAYAQERRDQLSLCNSGIYAARKQNLLPYLTRLEKKPHIVKKERGGEKVEIEEFFITDLVELMHQDGLYVGYRLAENEEEVMGVDDVASLAKAQRIFKASVS